MTLDDNVYKALKVLQEEVGDVPKGLLENHGLKYYGQIKPVGEEEVMIYYGCNVVVELLPEYTLNNVFTGFYEMKEVYKVGASKLSQGEIR